MTNKNFKKFDHHLLRSSEDKKAVSQCDQPNKCFEIAGNFHQLFERKVEKYPDKIAIIWKDKEITYRELNKLSNQLARHIISEYSASTGENIKPDTIVSLFLERGIDVIIGILGILKAGAAYTPIEINYPESRINYMLKDTNSKLLLTQSSLFKNNENKTSVCGVKLKCVFMDKKPYQFEESTNLEKISSPTDIAYVIYTSGTTGSPKGVMIEHQAFSSFLQRFNRRLDSITTLLEYNVLSLSSYVFDIFGLEYGLPLVTGSTVILSKPDSVEEKEISRCAIVQQTPSVLQQLVKIYPNVFREKICLVGGEALSLKIGESLLDSFKQVINVYGPAETTIWSTFYVLKKDQPIYIGKPLDDEKVFVLNKQLRPVPIQKKGELYISGIGLARGYLNDATLTTEKFIENPFATQEDKLNGDTRLYRTGDLVCWSTDGNLKYIGRSDFQIKLRGHRIELAEIESVLISIRHIRQACVIVNANINVNHIIAYYSSDKIIEQKKLRQQLSKVLPEYMIPRNFIWIEEFPVTINGKIDRTKLPNPDKYNIGTEIYAGPRNKIEELIHAWLESVLSINKISIYDDFFKIGGDSILSIQLASIFREHGYICDSNFIFKNRSIAVMAKNIKNDKSKTLINFAKVKNTSRFLNTTKLDTQLLDKLEKRAKQDLNEIQAVFPANILQKGFIYNYLKQSNDSTYHVQMIFEYKQLLCVENYKKAWSLAIEKYPALRTFFNMDFDIVQVIYKNGITDFRYRDISDLEEIKQQNQFIKNMLESDRVSYFDLSKPSLLRIHLIKINNSYFKIILSYHHCILDGVSEKILLDEVHHYYEKLKNSHQLTIQEDDTYLDVQLYYSLDHAEAKNYWKKEINYIKSPNIFPSNNLQKNNECAEQSNEVHIEIQNDLYIKLKLLISETGLTLNVLIQFAWHKLIQTYTQDEQTIVGTIVSGRDIPIQHINQSVGLYINTCPLRVDWNKDKISINILHEIHEKISELNSYSHIDLSNLRKDAFSLFSSLVVFNTKSKKQNSRNSLFIHALHHVEKLPYQTAILVDAISEQLQIKLLYHENKLSNNLAMRYLQQLETILSQLPEKLNSPWNQISLLTEEEFKQIVFRWNATKHIFNQEKLIHQLFEEQVSRNPDRNAVVFEKQKLTYGELNSLSNQLANYIQKYYKKVTKIDIKPDTLIAICVDRSLDMVIGILGILKAGGAYVPIDPDYPEERVNYILEDTQTKLVITQSQLQKKYSFTVDYIELGKKHYVKEQYDNLPYICKSDNLAYVIYTSGTTGKPKGVMIKHSGVPNFIYGYIKDNNLKPPCNICSFLSIGFDAIGSEIYTALFSGSTLFVASDRTRKNMEELSKFLQDNKIEIAAIPAAIINILPITEYPKKIVIMGDKCPTYYMQRWRDTGHQVMNGYGPTEITIGCTGAIYDGGKNTIIGKPMANRICYILDAAMNPVPIGVTGELYIGGVGISRGYLNSDQLTKERFIANPFSEKLAENNEYKKLYKTGDLAKWLEDGNIEYIGRKDFQVKLQGFRVEPSEIESVLLLFSGIKQCTIMVNSTDDVSNTKYMVAYYVSDQKICENTLRQYLLSKLPNYMVPQYFISMSAIAVNENGKVDKSKLPSYKAMPFSNAIKTRDYTAEGKLRAIWEEILGIHANQIKESDSFFDLGGTSISVALLKDSINKHFALQFSIADFFKCSNFSSLVNFISSRLDTVDTNDINRQEVGIHEDIAIIGLSGSFSGCLDIDDLWEILKKSKESIFVNSNNEIENNNKIQVDSRTPDIDKFDPNFWNISFEDAKFMDPQIRKFLESCWSVLEKSGYISKRKDLAIGVFAGCGSMNYLHENVLKSVYKNKINSWEVNTANGKDFLATRASYHLGLKGPALNINTACSTSLVAVVEACEKISSGKCDLALAGGVSFLPSGVLGYEYKDGLIFSKDGHCRVFDEAASGTTLGSGCGVVLLKSLRRAKEDKDNILAVIKGYAINNDGNSKVSYTAPSSDGQINCILKAQKMAEVSSDDISYIECHGTGTRIGDAIEVQALAHAFTNTSNRKFKCHLGSVKANIGHADSASGIAGLIKICKMFEDDLIVKQANYTQANNELNIENTPFSISTKNKKWSLHCGDRNRIAGISSFGIGGTNAHLIVTEYKNTAYLYSENPTEQHTKNTYFIPLSAKSEVALKNYKSELFKYLLSNPTVNIQKLELTLQLNREHYAYRSCITCTNYENLLDKLNDDSFITKSKIDSLSEQQVIFMFPGQGAQFENMGLSLYESDDHFKAIVDEGIAIINKLTKVNFKKILYPALYPKSEKINDIYSLSETYWAQPALFLTCYATAKFLQRIGISPMAYIGHSIGEYVAAALAGVFSFNDCIEIIILRGRLMQSSSLPGLMLAISESNEFIKDFLFDDLEIACINSTKMCVVSGPGNQIIKLQKKLSKFKVASKVLNVNRAFHSAMMKEASDQFILALKKVKFYPLSFPSVVSNLSGDFFEENNLPSAKYFGMHMIKPVEFSKGIKTIISKFSAPVFVEVGPGSSLKNFVNQYQQYENQEIKALSTLGKNVDFFSKDEIVKKMWLYGIKVNVFDKEQEKLASNDYNLYDLPAYQFIKKSFWIQPDVETEIDYVTNKNSLCSLDLVPASKKLEEIIGRVYETNRLDIEYKIAEIFINILGSESLSVYDNFYDLGGNSLNAVRLSSELKKIGIKISLSDIVNVNTIDKIASFYSAKILNTQSTDIVIPLTINHNRTNKNVFFIHPVGGSVNSYLKISNRLTDEYNYYGIQNININGKQLIRSKTLEELAKRYMKEILKIQKSGEYILMGSSMGGTIAYEIAIHLMKMGCDVKSISMFDSWAEFPDCFNNKSTFNKVMQEQDSKFENELFDIEENQKQYLQEARWQLMKLLLNFQVKKSNLNINLFKAKKLDQYHELNDKVDHNYWRNYTSGTINVYHIDGDHETIHDEPGLSQIIKYLNLNGFSAGVSE